MDIRRATLDTCGEAESVVVAIDVIRAFTTAAYAFAAGARAIIPVGTVEEALALRDRFPDALVMGEVGGYPPPGFDYGNSPAALRGADLGGRLLIQRTGAGTQGLVRSRRAGQLFAASLVCAAATARAILALAPECVTLVRTGMDRQGGEDDACIDHLAALLRGETPDPALAIRRVRAAVEEGEYPEAMMAEFADDLNCCADVDRFDFAMPVERRDGLLVMTAVAPA